MELNEKTIKETVELLKSIETEQYIFEQTLGK
jgi:hypothetical protein